MENVLKKIRDSYVSEIRRSLLGRDADDRLYCVFFPYFAWTAPAEELPEQGMRLDLLTQERRQKILDEHQDFGKRSYHSYCWAEFYGPSHLTLSLESKELETNLLRWYNYQQQDEFGLYNKSILNQIGRACTAACQSLNAMDWPHDRFTDDFVVFSSCYGDDPNDYGMKQCVTDEWISNKTSEGWFNSYFPIA